MRNPERVEVRRMTVVDWCVVGLYFALMLGVGVYFTRRGRIVVVLLCGGTKKTQQADIRRAIEIAKIWRK